MIWVRHYTEDDLQRIKELHAKQGLEYELPKLNDNLLAGLVIEEDGVISHAAFLRKTAEAYWLFDPQQHSRKERLGRLLMIQREMTGLAKAVELEDVHAWLPPELAGNKCLDLTMKHLGWVKPLWTCYSREVG
jgi:hypothetical protein